VHIIFPSDGVIQTSRRKADPKIKEGKIHRLTVFIAIDLHLRQTQQRVRGLPSDRKYRNISLISVLGRRSMVIKDRFFGHIVRLHDRFRFTYRGTRILSWTITQLERNEKRAK
jgi:hypothetical protein